LFKVGAKRESLPFGPLAASTAFTEFVFCGTPPSYIAHPMSNYHNVVALNAAAPQLSARSQQISTASDVRNILMEDLVLAAALLETSERKAAILLSCILFRRISELNIGRNIRISFATICWAWSWFPFLVLCIFICAGRVDEKSGTIRDVAIAIEGSGKEN
jgi:hypothetical protein